MGDIFHIGTEIYFAQDCRSQDSLECEWARERDSWVQSMKIKVEGCGDEPATWPRGSWSAAKVYFRRCHRGG